MPVARVFRCYPVLGGITVVSLFAGCFERGGNDDGRQRETSAWPTDSEVGRIALPSDPSLPPDPHARIRIALEASPANLNPLTNADQLVSRVVFGDVYEPLWRSHPYSHDLSPGLASAVSVSDDRRVFEFQIRAGVKWHDGQPLRAIDVVATFRYLQKPGRSWLAGEFQDLLRVESMTSDGREAVRFVFARARPARLRAFTYIPILPQTIIANTGHGALRSPVGTGPLRFVSWQGDRIVFARNTAYWGIPAKAAHIEYIIARERNRTAALLARGQLDVAIQLPIEFAQAQLSSATKIFSYPLPGYLAAVYNCRVPSLGRAEARRALTHAMDRDGIVASLFRGTTQTITGPFPGEPAGLRPLGFSVATAARLWRTPGSSLEVLVPAESRMALGVAQVWAQDARSFVQLEVVRLPYAQLLQKVRAGEFQVAILSFTTSADVDLYTRFHSTQVSRENYGAIKDAALDDLLVSVQSEFQPAKRQALQAALASRLQQLQPYTFIVADRRMGLANADIGGIRAGGALGARFLWRARKASESQ